MPRDRANPDDAAIGHRLRAYRIAKGLSQAALAEAIGISFQQVQKYEKGSNRIAGVRLKSAASALGVTVADLLDAPAGAMDALPANSDTARLVARLNDMPMARRKAVVKALESMIDAMEASNP